MTRALIDAEFHDTPIGRCVVVPRTQLCDVYDCARCLGGKHQRWLTPPEAGDVLAVVEGCPNSSGCLSALNWHCAFGGPEPECACDEWQTIYRRRGFVRVVETLPVVSSPSLEDGHHCVVIEEDYGAPRAVLLWTDDDCQPIDLPASPGDVVLVVEPWCETCRCVGHLGPATNSAQSDYGRRCPSCAPTPVRLVHRDGALGEVEG